MLCCDMHGCLGTGPPGSAEQAQSQGPEVLVWFHRQAACNGGGVMELKPRFQKKVCELGNVYPGCKLHEGP